MFIPVDVLLDITGHVKVDDVLHVGDIKTSGSHRSSHNDGRLTGLEPTESFFTLALSPVSVDGGYREPFTVQEFVKLVGALLRFNKNQGSAGLKMESFLSPWNENT